MEKKNKTGYVTIKESREIIKHNVKQMKYYEALKRTPKTESEYTSVMKNSENVTIILNPLIGSPVQFPTVPSDPSM